MIYHKHTGEVEISGVSDFCLPKIFECGQCFRWDSDENGVYTGVSFKRVVQLRSDNGNIYIKCPQEDYDNLWRDYFDIVRDYASIRKFLCIDDFMQEATDFGAGLRILKQDKWEALCSFIISQNNNIPRIKKIIEVLCREFGSPVAFDRKEYSTFPTPEKLASLNVAALAPLRCGYRAQYIIRTARTIADGQLDLEALAKQSPGEAKTALLKLHGVGNKVADCMLLFGLNMLDAFPRDVWINRAIDTQYGKNFDPRIFTPYSGIAQQYIFHYMRNR